MVWLHPLLAGHLLHAIIFPFPSLIPAARNQFKIQILHPLKQAAKEPKKVAGELLSLRSHLSLSTPFLCYRANHHGLPSVLVPLHIYLYFQSAIINHNHKRPCKPPACLLSYPFCFQFSSLYVTITLRRVLPKTIITILTTLLNSINQSISLLSPFLFATIINFNSAPITASPSHQFSNLQVSSVPAINISPTWSDEQIEEKNEERKKKKREPRKISCQ